jgi:hypothetical protein
MRRPALHIVVALLTFTVGVATAYLWANLRLRAPAAEVKAPADNQRPESEKCEEWEKAEAPGVGLGWDLTYGAALRRSGFRPDSEFLKWAATKPQPPVNRLAAEWRDDPIISAVLLEAPPVCVGTGGGWWLIRTKDHAYYWTFNNGKFDSRGKVPIPARDYDEALKTMACWRQDVPPSREGITEGYFGFLSLYKEGGSRQMLLTMKDFR